MSLPKQVFRQRDFSAGELDDHGQRRDDTPMFKAGCRQMLNKRILPTGALSPRPGRRALFEQLSRTEAFVTMDGDEFYVSFEAGRLKVRDVDGTIVLHKTGLPWTSALIGDICWDRYQDEAFICYPGARPRVLRWDAGVWTLSDFKERTMPNGQKRTPFRRFSDPGITMEVSDVNGVVTIVFSEPVLNPKFVGTRLRYQGRQLEVLEYIGPRTGKARVKEKLEHGSRLKFGGNPSGQFSIGDVVTGEETDAKGEVSSFEGDDKMIVSRSSSDTFKQDEIIVGPTGKRKCLDAENNLKPPPAVSWDEEIMNDMRGYPRSVTIDLNRLIFCDFPSLPRGIAWSAIDLPADLYPGANPEDSLFELAPGASRVYHVAAGFDQFIITSRGVFYIPISESNPLAPGSVAFRSITVDPAARLRPALTSEGMVYLSENLDRLVGIRATGQTARPYIPADIGEFHRHLLTGPISLIACTGTLTYPDHTVMVLNADGSVAVGRLDPARDWVGFVPWRKGTGGDGLVKWISSRDSKVIFTTRYNFNANRHIVELVDVDAPLDCMIDLANPPAALDAPGTQGPLWFLSGATVYVMVDGRPMDRREVDAHGNLVTIEGEDLSDAIVGFAWEEVLEPFVPHWQEGRSTKQTLRKRKLSKVAVKAMHATGFECANRRVPPWRTGDAIDLAPPLREEVKHFKPMGRFHDPRVAILKDVPGPMTIIEVSGEVTV